MDQICFLKRVPDFFLVDVLKLLPPSDLRNISMVCRRFKFLMEHSRNGFKVLDFTSLYLSMTSIPCQGIWRNVKNVECLSLRYCYRIRNFSFLRHMEFLTMLDVYATYISNADLNLVSGNLVGIDVGYCSQISGEGLLQFFATHKNIKFLGLSALNESVNDETLDALSNHGLKYLDLSNRSCVTTRALFHLLTKLQDHVTEMSLQGTCRGLLDMSRLNFIKLRILEIGANVLHHEEAVDDILIALSKCVNLYKLSLINCTVLNYEKCYFRHIPNLAFLYLWQCNPNVLKCIQNSRHPSMIYRECPEPPLSNILYLN